MPAVWKKRHLVKRNWRSLIILGVLSVGCFNTLAYIGLQSTMALNATFMQSTMPIMILCLSAFFLREKATVKQWFGVLLSLSGVSVLISGASLDALVNLQFNRGDLWVISAMLVWAIYSIGLRWKPVGLNHFEFLLITLIIGVVFLMPLAIWEQSVTPDILWNQNLVLLIAYLAIFPSILAYLFWNYGVEKLGARKAGLFIHLVPFWGVVLSITFLGEPLKAFHLGAIALIFAGIYLAVISDNTKITDFKESGG